MPKYFGLGANSKRGSRTSEAISGPFISSSLKNTSPQDNVDNFCQVSRATLIMSPIKSGTGRKSFQFDFLLNPTPLQEESEP